MYKQMIMENCNEHKNSYDHNQTITNESSFSVILPIKSWYTVKQANLQCARSWYVLKVFSCLKLSFKNEIFLL